MNTISSTTTKREEVAIVKDEGVITITRFRLFKQIAQSDWLKIGPSLSGNNRFVMNKGDTVTSGQ